MTTHDILSPIKVRQVVSLFVRNIWSVILIILCLMMIMSCANKKERTHTNVKQNNAEHLEAERDSGSESQANETNPESDPTADPIKEQVDQMTIEEKIGQMIMVGIEGTMVTDEARELIGKYHVGGIILFKKNMESSEQILQLLNDLKETNREERRVG